MASYKSEKINLLNRLSRIEGQVRGLQNMIEDEKYCVDVLTQIAAVKGALNKVGMKILEKHTHGCVKQAVANDQGEEIINELMEVINKFTK
ncbi:hypothetical protein Halha_2132 [Halobacteroides halobius DSM 5150]|uniref:Copper-sensing transcriptional repressor CsoR n=1 Tax=Halobacteroides halobius (strain ATCC 35273 / DSM 5150 / MD-1) TaxID=748449 RepID=L0KBU0_HALHC|nr:metal-sensitive transcriptional regulator [Halobacteroides halobius]AGB42015.1 hypothetical protein Halha_2132 [Halobacteroides halobius DSM 5150]